jgi:hypothetical protein
MHKRGDKTQVNKNIKQVTPALSFALFYSDILYCRYFKMLDILLKI